MSVEAVYLESDPRIPAGKRGIRKEKRRKSMQDTVINKSLLWATEVPFFWVLDF
jgi:hypothetical protein